MVSWPLSRPTITPHLIPLISAFIKSWRERRGWKGGDESGRESASLIKAKQAANRCPPRIFAQEIITPPSLCIILSSTGLLERHAERKEEFALAGSTRATIGVPCKSIPLLSFVRLQKKKEQNGNSRFVLPPFEAKGKILFLEKIRLETRIFKNIIFLRYLATLWLSIWYIVFFSLFFESIEHRLEYFEYFY